MNKSVLSISLDPNIANQTYADAHTRHLEYAKAFDHYTVITLNKKTSVKKEYHFSNLHVYLTNVVWKYWAVPKAIVMAIKLHQTYQFDIITTQDPLVTGIVGFILKYILNIPLNIQFHEVYDLEDRRTASFLIKFLLHHTNSTRIVNSQLFNQINNQFPKLKTHHIPMMVDIDYFYKQIKPKNTITNFISVGRLIPSKNFTLLIDAFSQVVKSYPNIRLKIVGNGISTKSIQNQIKQIKQEDNIKLVGMLNREQLRTAYHQADAFILASNIEGWGNVFIEAAAAGLPIISTKVGAVNGYFASDEIIVTQIANQDKLAQGIVNIVKNPENSIKMALRAQARVLREYNKNKLKDDWLNLLKQTK